MSSRFLSITMGLAGLLAAGSAAQAMEFGQMRAMQTGPVGDSPQFDEMGKERYEGEAVWGLERTFGSYELNEDTDSRTAATGIRSRLAVGGAIAPSKTFLLSGYIDATLASDYDENRTRATNNYKYDGGLYKHELALFALYKANPFVFGGGIGVILFGSEEKDFRADAAAYRVRVGSAAMPTLRLFGGIALKQFDATLGIRTFSKGRAVVESSAGGATEEYDIVRRNPGEIHADARLSFPLGYVAADVAYVLTGQASAQQDEFSTRYVTAANGKKVRQSGLGRINADTLRLGVGGRFNPMKLFGILGGIAYETAGYKEDQLASPEQQNLGGLRFDLGSEVIFRQFRGMLDFGYKLDQDVSYTVSNSDRAQANADRTLKPPQNKDDKVKMTQGALNIALAAGIAM